MKLLVLGFLAQSCSPSVTPDASVDAGVLMDGGQIDTAGGCFNPDGAPKFILYLETPTLCGAVSFRPSDGGFVPLFMSRTTAPESYAIDDARIGLCSMPVEQANGRLNAGAAAIEDFTGDIGWAVFQGGRPYTYSAHGTLTAFGTTYWFSAPPEGASLTDPCRGP